MYLKPPSKNQEFFAIIEKITDLSTAGIIEQSPAQFSN